MAKTTGQVRSEVIGRMREAVKEGLSASKFISTMRERGLSYRRTDMLSDWRSVGNTEKKTGLLRYVRKDFKPSPDLYAEVSWDLKREYMFKVSVYTRTRPGEKPKQRFINVMSDRTLTPGEVEQEVLTRWAGWYPDSREEIVTAGVETAFRKVYE